MAPSSLAKQANGSVGTVEAGDAVSVDVYLNGVFQPGGIAFIVNSAAPVTNGAVPLVGQNDGDATAAVAKSKGKLSGGTLTIPGSGGLTYRVIGVVDAPAPALGWGVTRRRCPPTPPPIPMSTSARWPAPP